jgi:two-component system, OmpR family, phosphate regulon sensor histidine kinase PhoR
MLEFVAISGSPDGREALLGQGSPVDVMLPILALGEVHGPLRFIAREQMPDEVLQSILAYGWTPDIPDTREPDRWRPEDMLILELRDGRGVLRGLLYLDEPLDDRRRTGDELAALSRALQAPLHSLVTTIEREALAQRDRVARAAREVIRNASTQLALTDLLALAEAEFEVGFRAREVRIRLAGQRLPSFDSSPATPGGALDHALLAAGRRAWSAQQVVVAEHDRVWGDDRLHRAHAADLAAHLREHDLESLVLVPVGAATEPLGVIVAALRDHRWTDSEGTAALDAGHDLGRAITNARAFEREQELVRELQGLDAYRIELISTVAHELRNPIGVIRGHLELLGERDDLPDGVRRSLDLIDRGADRLSALSGNLLELGRLGSAPAPPDRDVLVDQVVSDAVDFLDVTAAHHGVSVLLQAPTDTGPWVVRGDHDELHRMIVNLVSNAVKYSSEGSTVRVSVSRADDQVVFTCADEGLGISEEDRARLFTEFFRTSNLEALRRPGTGLGLSIVDRIVARHRGRVELGLELGVGTTFRVLLPVAPPR